MSADRRCAGPGCERSLASRHAAVRYCSGKCRTRAFRARQMAAAPAEGGQLRYADPAPTQPTPAGSRDVTTQRQRRRGRVRADVAWLVDHDDPDRVKALLLELAELYDAAARRGEIRQRAMTMRPRGER